MLTKEIRVKKANLGSRANQASGKKANLENQGPEASQERMARKGSEGRRDFLAKAASRDYQAERDRRETKATLDPQAPLELSLAPGRWARKENRVTLDLLGLEVNQDPKASQDSEDSLAPQVSPSQAWLVLPASLETEARKAIRGHPACRYQDQVERTGSRVPLGPPAPRGSQATPMEL